MQARRSEVENADVSRNKGNAVVRESVSLQYKTCKRTFGDVFQSVDEEYRQVLASVDRDAVASFAGVSRLCPRVTIIPSWNTNGKGCPFGWTLGKYQYDPCETTKEILGVYEVQSGYAAMLIDSPSESTMTLVALRPGDKVGTPNHCIATIFSLGDSPTILWDITNANSQETRTPGQQPVGPALILSYECRNLLANIPKHYLNRNVDGFGVKNPQRTDSIVLPVEENRPETIYAGITSDFGRREFENRGIKVAVPDNLRLARQMGIPSNALSGSIRSLRKDKTGHPLRDYLFREPGIESRRAAVLGSAGHSVETQLVPSVNTREYGFECVEPAAV